MKSATILIVEDEAITAVDIRDTLEEMGHTVCSVVTSGEDAIAMAEQDRPDLVIMDVILIGAMDGIDAADQISRELKIPVIFVTAYADETMMERIRQTKAAGYLVKPFTDEELGATIQGALLTWKG